MERLTTARAAQLAHSLSAEQPSDDQPSIEVATLDDLPALLKLARECFEYNTPTARELRYAISHAHAALYVFREPGSAEIIAYTLVELNRRTLSMYANCTCVTSDWRGRGIGRRAIALRRSLAEALGYRSIRTHIAIHNAASLHLALSSGYSIVSTIPDYYDDGGACHLLRLRLATP
jgi:ribosomal protein S18 acetylase RimI-like enzyme